MAWITGYTVHTWELAALRAWGVTFITVTIAPDMTASPQVRPLIAEVCNSWVANLGTPPPLGEWPSLRKWQRVSE